MNAVGNTATLLLVALVALPSALSQSCLNNIWQFVFCNQNDARCPTSAGYGGLWCQGDPEVACSLASDCSAPNSYCPKKNFAGGPITLECDGREVTFNDFDNPISWTPAAAKFAFLTVKAGTGFCLYQSAVSNEVWTPDDNSIDNLAGCLMPASGEGDPIMTGFYGSKYKFDGKPGSTVALLTEAAHQVNARLELDADEDANWTWMTGLAVRYEDTFNLTLTLDKNTGGYKELPKLKVVANGEDVTNLLFNGRNATFADGKVMLRFPAHNGTNNEGLQWSNLVIIDTPTFEFTAKVTTRTQGARHGSTPHLDMHVGLLAPVDATAVHGVLGHSLSWKNTTCMVNCRDLLPGSDEDYEVDGMLGSNFKYSKFGAGKAVQQQGRRLMGKGAYSAVGMTASMLA